MRNCYRLILFDLDGTLTDSKVGIMNSLNYALKKSGIVEDNLEKIDSFIGPPLVHAFSASYGLSEEKAVQAVNFYREYFREKGLFENRLYEGVYELLAGLKERGLQIALATSKPTVFAERILEHFSLNRFFDLVVGSNLDNTRCEKAEVIAYVLSCVGTENIKLSQVVMVGDRKHDIIGAKENGIDSIGVTYGYGETKEIEEAGPTYLVNSVSELNNLLRRITCGSPAG